MAQVDAVAGQVFLRVSGEPPTADEGVGDEGFQAPLGRVGDHARSFVNSSQVCLTIFPVAMGLVNRVVFFLGITWHSIVI